MHNKSCLAYFIGGDEMQIKRWMVVTFLLLAYGVLMMMSSSSLLVKDALQTEDGYIFGEVQYVTSRD